MGIMLVASLIETKEMILTHGECERSSIVLGMSVGGDAQKKKRRILEIGRYLEGPH